MCFNEFNVSSVKDYTRKEADYAKLVSELRDNYASSCKQMGIEVVTEML